MNLPFLKDKAQVKPTWSGGDPIIPYIGDRGCCGDQAIRIFQKGTLGKFSTEIRFGQLRINPRGQPGITLQALTLP